MNNLLIVTGNMVLGGISSSLISLLNQLSTKQNYSISLIILGNYIDDKYILPKNIKIIKTGIFLELLYSNFKKIIKNYRLIYTPIFIFIRLLSILSFSIALKFCCLFESEKRFDKVISYSNDSVGKVKFYGSNLYVLKKCKTGIKVSWLHNDPLKLGFTKKYVKNQLNKFDYIVGVSKVTIDKLSSIYQPIKLKCKVFYNLIDKEEIKTFASKKIPKEYSFNNSLFNIITVSRLDKNQKRLDRVIELSYKLLTQYNFKNFLWRIVGSGNDYYRLNSLINYYQISNNVKLISSQSNPFNFIRNSDLFVLTSEYEAQGLVIFEALLCNTPVIVMPFDEIFEFISNIEKGLVTVGTKDLDSFASLIHNFYNKIKTDVLFSQQLNKKLNNYNYDITHQQDFDSLFS